MGIDVINFLRACESPTGGFGGGPLQLPHLAPTYAAIAALVSIGGDAALTAIDRVALLAFIRRMCVPHDAGGGIAVSEGETLFTLACNQACPSYASLEKFHAITCQLDADNHCIEGRRSVSMRVNAYFRTDKCLAC